MAVGALNNANFAAFFIAGRRGQDETWFIQEKDGNFQQKNVSYKKDKLEEDAGTLLFDADNDGDLDLYIARGCGQYPSGNAYYKDVLMIND